MKRREFIILSGIGATSASLLSACGHPEEKLIPAFIPDDEYVPGIDYWKASTCGLCPAGCGIIVRTREHKANKIEGNPLHPVNRGALCARGQAGLEVLYNPDRIKGPMKRVGERGEGKWEEISWEEGIKTLADRLRKIKATGEADNIIFATASARGVIAVALELFRSVYRARFTAVEETITEESANFYWPDYKRMVTPIYDIGNATYLLSFGARFLETWHSPVMYSLAYGEFRRKSGKARGKFVQVEPRMSLTAANADEWLPARVSSEGLVALAIAQVIIRENLVKGGPSPSFLEEPLDEYAPEKTQALTDLPAEKIIRMAREFAASERPLAIGAGAGASVEQKQANSRAINFLNMLKGNLNKPGGVLLPEYDFFDPLENLRDKAQEIPEVGWLSTLTMLPQFEAYSALLLHNVNPLHFAPRKADGIKSIPFIASFSTLMDETTQLADLILPDHSYLESWDLKTTLLGGSRAAVSIVKPVVAAEFNTRQTADVLIALCGEFGYEPAEAATFESAEAIVKRAMSDLASRNKASTEPTDDDAASQVIELGVWVGDATGAVRSFGFEQNFPLPGTVEHFSDAYPLTLLTYQHATLGFGEYANLTSLQELPDPMTSVMWGSWVEINPKTAASMGIADGDLVEVSTPHGSLHAPAVLYPAIRPDVIAMPYGQGHMGYGRYANGRGASAAVLNPYAITGEGREETVRARVTRIGGKVELIRFGTDLQERMENKR